MGKRGPARRDRGASKWERQPPRAPKGATPALRAQFRRLALTLPDMTAADETLLESLAQAILLQRAAYALLEKDGLLEPDAAHGGALKRSPALIVWRSCAEVARAAAMRLGASPLDRQRLPAADKGPTLQDILYGSGQREVQYGSEEEDA